MLRYELTPNNAGFILWGDSEALNELHELIHYIVDESPLIKVKDGFMLSLAYDIRKAREGNRRVQHNRAGAFRRVCGQGFRRCMLLLPRHARWQGDVGYSVRSGQSLRQIATDMAPA